jgi:hypothetical protein
VAAGSHPEGDKFKRKKGDTKMTYRNKKTDEKKKAPVMRAYHVREGKDDTSYWSRPIGAVWQHEDGKGFNVQLDMMPLDGRIVLREPKEGDGA